MKCILLFLSLVCSLSVSAQYCSEVWSPDNGDGTYTNPVIAACFDNCINRFNPIKRYESNKIRRNIRRFCEQYFKR